MAKPFDVATKHLVEADPIAWLRYAGLPGARAELIDADLSTVTSEADRIIHVHEPEYLAHIELQASYAADMGNRMLVYGVLAHAKFRLPVQSVVVLLRKQADGQAMSGRAGYQVPESPDGSVEMRFRVVRVWNKNAEEMLSGPLATLPLAPLAKVAPEQLPSVVNRMEQRIGAEAPIEDRGMLWTTTFLLMGLKYDPQLARRLLKGVMEMKESATYKYILEEGAQIGRQQGESIGAIREARRILLRQGGKRFGPPDATVQAAIENITSLESLERFIDRVQDVETWTDLLTLRSGQ